MADITVDNLTPGEVVRYPVLALKGTVQGKSFSMNLVGAKQQKFPLVGNRFAALIELKPGPNMVESRSGRDTMRMKVEYRPMANPNRILTVFVHASDESEVYKLSPAGDRPRVREKLDVAMKLMQSMTAEAMRAAGYGRKTFPLELDKDGKVVVHFVTAPKTGDELRAMDNYASWGYVYDLLKPQFDEFKSRWTTMIGWTGWDPKTKSWKGHYALGGGALGAFGTGSMVHWPATISDVPRVFMDATVIDPAQAFEDSAYRRTVWANVSTAYGAMLHEMGHTFGLPHSPDRFSVMSRGFDLFSRFFTVVEAPRQGQTDNVTFTPDQVTKWDPFFAARLNLSPFFQSDTPPPPGEAPTITRAGDAIRLRAPQGIRVWGAENDDTPAVWEEKKEAVPPSSITLSLKDLRDRLKTIRPFRVTIVDKFGQWTTIDVKD